MPYILCSGVYGIHKQLLKHNMTTRQFNSTDVDGDHTNSNIGHRSGIVDHVVVVPNTLNSKYQRALVEWLGESNVHQVDTGYLMDRLTAEQGMWKQTFQKLWLHNLTMYDKVIVLDADVLIRTNIMHWFKYPTPCGIQAHDQIAWNSGALVIKPDTAVFDQMMDMLPNISRYELKKIPENGEDIFLNAGYGDQE